MSLEPVPDEKWMRLRYAGTCHLCSAALPAGEPAIYERVARRVRCIYCAPDAEINPGAVGSAGASARREYERRKSAREKRVRERHPKLGGLILALFDDPQSTMAWERGAIGEEMLARRLEDLPAPAVVLHDRHIRGTRANIDHVVITSSGVWVVDAKRYKGKRPQCRVDGGILRPRVESLRIGGRDGTRLVTGVQKQVSLVVDALGESAIPVHGVLCFLEADWPLFGGGFTVDDTHVLWPRLLVKRVIAAPPCAIDIATVYARLASIFPVA